MKKQLVVSQFKRRKPRGKYRVVKTSKYRRKEHIRIKRGKR